MYVPMLAKVVSTCIRMERKGTLALKDAKRKCKDLGVGFSNSLFLTHLTRSVMMSKIQRAFMGSIIGTAAMSAFMMITHLMGMPKMNPPQMLSTMTGFPIFVG